MEDSDPNKYVEFEYKKEKVRSNLKKRARQYKSDSSDNESDHE
jgi:hypothetical protein